MSEVMPYGIWYCFGHVTYVIWQAYNTSHGLLGLFIIILVSVFSFTIEVATVEPDLIAMA